MHPAAFFRIGPDRVRGAGFYFKLLLAEPLTEADPEAC